MTQIVILSVPYCEPYPMVAPALLSSCLNQAGISSEGIDFNIDFFNWLMKKSYFEKFKFFLCNNGVANTKLGKNTFKEIYKFTYRYLKNIQNQFHPEWIGLSIFSTESLDFGLFMSYVIRRHWPNTKIIAGGKGLEVNNQAEIWALNSVADTVVIGDAEIEIINSIKQDKRGLIRSPKQTKEDLDSFPLASWSNYDLEKYNHAIPFRDHENSYTEPYMAITGSKGCVRSCSFCDVGSFWPEYLYRDPSKIANEMVHNYRNTNIREFEFTDNLINGSISNYRKLNQQLLNLLPPKTLRYRGYAIFRGKNQMPEEDFRLAADAGCMAWSIGVESGSEKIRFQMKKKFSNDDIDWSVNLLYKYHIRQSWLLMVGYPTETDSDFEETLKLLKRYSHLNNNKMILINVIGTFSLLSNSPILMDPQTAQEHGVSHHINNNDTFYWTSSLVPENTWPTRSNRLRKFMNTVEDLNYGWSPKMSLQKIKSLLEIMDQKYHEQHRKIFPINPAK